MSTQLTNPEAFAVYQDPLEQPAANQVPKVFWVIGLTITLVPLLLLLPNIQLYEAVPLAVLFGLTGQRLIELMLASDRDLFAPDNLITGYFILYFGLRAAYVMTIPEAPRLGLFFYDDHLPASLWCAAFGYLAFLAGYHSGLAGRLWSRLPQGSLCWPEAVPGVRICGLLAVGFAAWLYLFSRGAFVVGAVSEQAGRNFHCDPIPGLPVLLGSLLDFGWVATCVSLWQRPLPPNRLTGWLVALLAIGLILVRVAFTGGKQFLLEPLVQAIIVYNCIRRRLRIRQALLIGLPCAFLAFGALNVYRFVIIGESGGAPTGFQDVLSRLSYAWDYFTSDRAQNVDQSAFEALMRRQFGVDALALVMKYTPDKRPFGYGASYLKIPEQALIPRQLWRDKPIYIPTDDFERDYLGVPPGGFSSMHVISDLYQNFHLPGVACGFFALGIGFRLFYLCCAPWTANGMRVFVYALLLPGLVHALEGEPVVNCVVYLRTGLLLFLAMKVLGRGSSQPPEASPC